MAKKRIDILYIRMKYNKQPLDIPALLAMLKARGGAIGDEQEAVRQKKPNRQAIRI